MAQLPQLAIALGGAIAFLLIRLFLRRRALLRHLPVPVSIYSLTSLARRSYIDASYVFRKASHASRPGFGATRRLFLRMKLVFYTLNGQTISTSERPSRLIVHGSYAIILLFVILPHRLTRYFSIPILWSLQTPSLLATSSQRSVFDAPAVSTCCVCVCFCLLLTAGARNHRTHSIIRTRPYSPLSSNALLARALYGSKTSPVISSLASLQPSNALPSRTFALSSPSRTSAHA